MTQRTDVSLIRQTTSGSARDALAGTTGRAASLYVHVPFCFHKCHYCDFYSIVDTRDRHGVFVDRLVNELRALARLAAPLRTIFVGGGTPTLLAPALWERLLGELAAMYDLSPIRRGEGEFTVECNPETATPELFAVLARGGVNRVSIGAQSFDPRHLKTLERWHDPANVGRAVALARDAGIARQSVDLIFAIPGQTLDDWRRDLDAALAMNTEHLSCYALTYEPGTAMAARLARGDFARTDEDLEADMFEWTGRTLADAGRPRYEVSNFARPGAASRHNLAYWRQENWLAAGPAASGHMDGRRWKNTPRLDDYLSKNDAGFAPIAEFEPADATRNLSEFIMTGLRLTEGLDARATAARVAAINAGAVAQIERAVERQKALGGLADDPDRWRLTESGFLIANRVILDLLAALDRRLK